MLVCAENYGCFETPAQIRAGTLDQYSAVQAFALHRHTSQAGLFAELRYVAALLGGPADGDWTSLEDDDRVEHTVMLRIGDLRRLRALITQPIGARDDQTR